MSRRRHTKPRPTIGVAAAGATAVGRRRSERRDHGARVSVDEPTWLAFKQIAAERSIGVVLGELVCRHVHTVQARQARDGQLEDGQLLEALDRAHELQHDLGHLLRRIEDRLDRSARQPSVSPSPDRAAPLPFPGG